MPSTSDPQPEPSAKSGGARLWSRYAIQLQRVATWIETHPGKALWLSLLLVLLLVGFEANYWPSHDFPGALWHQSPRGDDIELAQANAAKAGWPELLSYWYGPMIHGHGYYRPITSWLFVAEYRLFGTADGKWAFLNIALHLGVCIALVWAGGMLAGGSAVRRLTIGTAAALMVGAPVVADRVIQFWICGWWPCQSEMLSLLAGLTLLGATARFVDTGSKRWLTLAVGSMVFGILCKEMTYVAALGACLLLVRHRRRWWGGVALALPAVALFAFRKWAIRNVAAEGGIPMDDFLTHFVYELEQIRDQLTASWMYFAILPVAILLGCLILRRSGWLERAIAGAMIHAGLITVTLGLPWELPAAAGYRALLQVLTFVAVVVGLGRAARRWPVVELCVVWLLTQLPAYGFMPIFAWYRYWGSVFGALLLAIAMWEWIEWWAAPRLRPILCPTGSKGQTPASPPPLGDGSPAIVPSAA